MTDAIEPVEPVLTVVEQERERDEQALGSLKADLAQAMEELASAEADVATSKKWIANLGEAIANKHLALGLNKDGSKRLAGGRKKKADGDVA